MKTQKFKILINCIALTAIIILISACNTGNENTKEKSVKPATDIHTAVVVDDIVSVRQHIAYGSDLDSIEPTGGSTALITAIVLGKSDIALALIEGGADINKSNNDGSTPLYCAAFFGRTKLVEALLEADADKSIRNNFGSTALESVTVPFDAIKGIYDQISKDMGPLGFKLDYEKLQEERIVIAELLQ